jgi:2,4-dienoyl-CoA reductase-like NADH-dependent reductase (Old Yellow Enzyme family)
VELHLAHGYLLHEFLSEHTNKREDNYGGSLKNRVRLILEIISGIRKKAPDLIVGARVSGKDYIIDGINERINRKLLPILEDAGIEYFSVTAGIYDTSSLKHEAMKKGEFFAYSKKIKGMVNKVVISAGKILDMDSAEAHLKNGDCDMVAIGRGLISDPMMVNKVRSGQAFIRCLECDQCQYLRLGKKDLVCPVRGKEIE